MGYVDIIDRAEVQDFESFAAYTQQVTGIPYPTMRDKAEAKKKAKALLEQYPHLTWRDLTGLPLWARSKKRRYATLARLVDAWRYAWEDGHLPELNTRPVETDVEDQISNALVDENDPVWRERLLAAEGMRARREVLDAWKRKTA